MDTVAIWISAVGAVVAAVAAVVAAIVAVRANRGASRQAASASESASRSADAAERSAAAQTTMAERFVPDWNLTRNGAMGIWTLRNDNGETAYGVTIDASPWDVVDEGSDRSTIGAGSSIAFQLVTDDAPDIDDRVLVPRV